MAIIEPYDGLWVSLQRCVGGVPAQEKHQNRENNMPRSFARTLIILLTGEQMNDRPLRNPESELI